MQNTWYHGWGIHWVGSGWVYNVSGWEAVEIVMRNGRRHRIGTDDPNGLAQAIRQVIFKHYSDSLAVSTSFSLGAGRRPPTPPRGLLNSTISVRISFTLPRSLLNVP